MDGSPSPDTRDRILQAALDLFGARGYQRTSLREIAERLDLTKAGVLYHFPSKEHLLVALIEPLVSDMESALARSRELPWPESRWAMLEGWLDTLLAHRRSLGMLLHDLTMLRNGSSFTRMLRLAARAYDLIAGPHASRIERIRAVQATAMLGDPILFFTDVPDQVLRAEMLDGVARLLGEPPAGRVAPPPVGAGNGTGTAAVAGDDTGTAAGPAVSATGPEVPGPGEVTFVDGGISSGRARPERARPGGRRTAGRPRALTGEQIRAAQALHAEGIQTVDEIAARFGVSRATLYRHLRVGGSPDRETDFETI